MTLVMTQRGKFCHLAWCWLWNREANIVVLCYVEYDREANCDGRVWRDDERDAHVCVVSTNGDLRGGGGESVGFCADSGFPVGSRSAGGLFFWWAFVPLPGRIYSKEKLTHFLSRQEPDFFFLSLSLSASFTEVFQSVLWLGFSISSVEFGLFTQLLMTLTL